MDPLRGGPDAVPAAEAVTPDAPAGSAAPDAPVEPLPVPMLRIVEAGLGLWALALVVVLVVPGLHTGPRGWWPWCCLAGLGLGAVGWVYLRRGRGNAASA